MCLLVGNFHLKLQSLSQFCESNRFSLYTCRLQQASDLAKYEAIWATYEAKYESMEEVQKIRRKKDELNSIKEQSKA